MASVYFGQVIISDAMAIKIQSKHGVTPFEVREACSAVERAGWNNHPDHGCRLLVIGKTSTGRRLKVILEPVDVSDGTWRLRTAFEAKRR